MKEKACVLVCVTQQSSCERLIEAGASIAESRGMDLGVINVQPEKNGFTPDPAAIEHLYNVSRKFGADMSYYFSDSPAAVVAAHGVKNNAEIIVTGFPGKELAFCSEN